MSTRKLIALLRVEYKHDKNVEKYSEKYGIVEFKVLRPEFDSILRNQEHRCDIAILMSSLAVKSLQLSNVRVLARYVVPIGEDTLREVEKCRQNFSGNIELPRHYSSHGIVDKVRELVNRECLRNVNVYRSQHGTDILVESLRKLDLKVNEYKLYRLVPNIHIVETFIKCIDMFEVIIPMSTLTIKSVVDMLDEYSMRKLQSKIIICPGPEVYRFCRRIFSRVYMADNATIENIFQLVDRILQHEHN